MIYLFFLSLAASLIGNVFILKRFDVITDHLHKGPQKVHDKPTPRLGGVSLYLSLIITSFASIMLRKPYAKELLMIAIISTIPFFTGLVEDITAKTGAKNRLIIIVFSSLLGFSVLDAKVARLDIPIVDLLLENTIVSAIFTSIAITGITNAINIIDGLNGLASMTAIMILLSTGYVAFKVGDTAILTSSLILIGTLLGFLTLNYPFGFIFLGDCGAYLTGFIIGILVVLIVKRHNEVSPWFALLVCIYPVFETLFSMYRRKLLRGDSPTAPDRLHLHSLVYGVLLRKLFGSKIPKLYRNSLASTFLWALNAMGVVPATLFWDKTPTLIVFTIIFITLYLVLYYKLLFLKIPSWARKSLRKF